MKIKLDVEIDCTPEELKELWNAPDLTPLHNAFLRAMQDQMRDQLATSPAAAWMKLWGLDAPLQALGKMSDREQ